MRVMLRSKYLSFCSSHMSAVRLSSMTEHSWKARILRAWWLATRIHRCSHVMQRCTLRCSKGLV